MTNRNKILEVKNLKQYFKISRKNIVKAVDGISFDIYEGETFSLVGESGSGKSTTGRSIIRLYKPTSGDVIYKGEDISKSLSKEEKKELSKEIQMIFQDPMASLNPRKKVLDIIAQGLDVHKSFVDKTERYDLVVKIIKSVGLSEEHLNRYPHQFSGGQRQRIGIARALILKPSLVIADEPISALDVSIQAQVVNLMQLLQEELGLTYLFIAHDLSMVRYISDRIAVMHLGKIVELCDASEIFSNAIHPYTKSLVSAIPQPDPKSERKRKRIHYQAIQEDYQGRELHEISKGHFVLGTEEEIENWTSNL